MSRSWTCAWVLLGACNGSAGSETGSSPSSSTTSTSSSSAADAASTTSSAASDSAVDASSSNTTSSAASESTSTNTSNSASTSGSEGTSSTSGEASSTTDAPVGEPRVHFIGRHDDSDPEAVRYGWSGTGFLVRFEGTAVHATLDDAAGFHTVVVDGTAQGVLETQPGERRYTLVSDLSPGEHVVALYRRTEGNFGLTTVRGVEVEGTLLPPPTPTRRLEVVGDSITCGYGNEGADQYCPFTGDTENHYLTYAAIAARALGAELSAVAWSGKGVIYNYGDDTFEPMPTLYDRTLPTEADPRWSGPSANVVLINLGTNDFSTDDDPPPEDFIAAYVDLLAAIRVRNPDAEILATVAPALDGSEGEASVSGIDAAIAERAAEGDTRIARVDISVPAEGFGCDWHPSLPTHAAMAERLIPLLEDAYR